MPKSLPKQKPQGSKKKMPMSILGLLGLALVLVGIVAAIGLMQISQDGRSKAGGCNPWDLCYQPDGNGIERLIRKDASAARLERAKLAREAQVKAEAARRGIEREAQGSFQEAAKMDATAARKAGGTSSQQPTGTQATGGSTGGSSSDSNTSSGGSSRGSSSSVSIAPTNMRVECSSDNKSAKIRWDNKGKANSFYIGVDKINSCSSPVDGWMCAPGDFVKTISCTDSSCSYRFNVEKGRYGTVAITAIKGDQRIESKLTKGFACR